MRSRKGFTVIELLIVIIVIAILAAIAVPQYRNMQNRARVAQAVSGLEVIYKAEALFYAENASYAANFAALTPIMREADSAVLDTALWQYTLAAAFPLEGFTATATMGLGGPTITVDEDKNYTCPAAGPLAGLCP